MFIFNVMKKARETLLPSNKTLIVIANKLIKKYHKGVIFERTYFEAVVVGDGKVEMIGMIDGGPLVGRKVCSNKDEVQEFISATSATYN